MADKTTSHWPITVTNGVAAFFSIGLPLALVRIVSPEDLGRYNVFFLYVMLTPGVFLTGGLNNGLYHWAGKRPEATEELRQSWWLIMTISVVALMVGLLVAPWVRPLLHIAPIDYRLILLSLPFNLGAGFLEDLMIARGQIWLGSWYGSGSNISRTMVLLLTAWITHRMELVFWMFFAITLLRMAVGLVLLRGAPELDFLFSKERMRNVLRYAFPVSIAGTAALALHYVDRILLSFRLTRAQFAFYSYGCLIVPPLEILAVSVNKVLIPRMSQAFSDQKPAQAAALFSESVGELFRILMPATVGLILYSHPIVNILFTARFSASAEYLKFYALTYLFMALPYDALARARGDGKWIFKMSSGFAVLSVMVTWAAMVTWGAIGALLGMLLIQLCMRLYSLHYMTSRLGLPVGKFFPFKEMTPQVVLVTAVTGLSWLCRSFFSDDRWWFLVTGPIFTLLYFGATYFLVRYRSNAAVLPGEAIPIFELTQTLCLGGIERTVVLLSRSLAETKDFAVTVGVYEHPEDQMSLGSELEKNHITLLSWHKEKGVSWRAVYQLTRLLKAQRSAILHVHDLGPLFYGSLAKLFTLRPLRMAATIHTSKHLLESKKYRAYYKYFLKLADEVIAASDEVKSALVTAGVPAELVKVITNGVEFPAHAVADADARLGQRRALLPKSSDSDLKAFWILCLARLHEEKGQELILKVWADLSDTIRRSSLLIFVGQETQAGYMDRLAQFAKMGPNWDRVLFPGASDQPWNWIQCSDVFVSGSALEGRPLAPLEAAGSGTPLLLTDIEGHRFLKPWGHFFDIHTPADGSKKLTDLFNTLMPYEAAQAQHRWVTAAPVRERWGKTAMTKDYSETFKHMLVSPTH